MIRIRVSLVEDDGLLRRTLRELLSLDEALNIVGDHPNGLMALEALDQDRPEVVLTDIDMPKMDGITATREMLARNPDVKVVVLTKFGDDEKVFAALKAGAIGYVLKDADMDEIKRAIHEASEGIGHLSPALVANVMGEFRKLNEQSQANRKLFSELSHRELEVLELLGKGLRNKAIGDQLSLSEKTVKAHVGAVLRKLHLNDRTEAALIAQKHGL